MTTKRGLVFPNGRAVLRHYVARIREESDRTAFQPADTRGAHSSGHDAEDLLRNYRDELSARMHECALNTGTSRESAD